MHANARVTPSQQPIPMNARCLAQALRMAPSTSAARHTASSTWRATLATSAPCMRCSGALLPQRCSSPAPATGRYARRYASCWLCACVARVFCFYVVVVKSHLLAMLCTNNVACCPARVPARAVCVLCVLCGRPVSGAALAGGPAGGAAGIPERQRGGAGRRVVPQRKHGVWRRHGRRPAGAVGLWCQHAAAGRDARGAKGSGDGAAVCASELRW